MVSSIERFHCIQDSQLGPNGVLYREVHCIQDSQLGPSGVLYREVHCIQDSQLGPNGVLYREVHCIQDSQLGPNGVLYREVSLYIIIYLHFSDVHPTVPPTQHCSWSLCKVSCQPTPPSARQHFSKLPQQHPSPPPPPTPTPPAANTREGVWIPNGQ